MAYTNGGGAFLIPYIFVLLFIGRPLYLLELGLGQFSSSGSARVWDMVPALRGETNFLKLNLFFPGVGYGQVMATTCVLTYYCTLIGLSLFYLGSSLCPTLPWTDCDDNVGTLSNNLSITTTIETTRWPFLRTKYAFLQSRYFWPKTRQGTILLPL